MSFNKVLKFAAECHGDQKRLGSNASYIIHPVMVWNTVCEWFGEERNRFSSIPYLFIPLLHDVLEDTDVSENDLIDFFDSFLNDNLRNDKSFRDVYCDEIISALKALMLDKSISVKKNRMQDSLTRIKNHPGKMIEKEFLCIVKLADRYSNLEAPPEYWDRNKCKKYLKEAKIIFDKLMPVIDTDIQSEERYPICCRPEVIRKAYLEKLEEYKQYIV